MAGKKMRRPRSLRKDQFAPPGTVYLMPLADGRRFGVCRVARHSTAAEEKHPSEPHMIVVASPRALNKLRYYAGQAGGQSLDIRCALPERVPLSPHVSHVVSLAEGDAVAAGSEFTAGRDTVWMGGETTAPPAAASPAWTITYARVFEGGEATRFTLARYQRAAAAR